MVVKSECRDILLEVSSECFDCPVDQTVRRVYRKTASHYILLRAYEVGGLPVNPCLLGSQSWLVDLQYAISEV